MEGVTIANQILDHIVKEGKQLYVDRKVTRQKMPVYSNHRTQAMSSNAIIHSGYQHQTNKLKCFSMTQEPQPITSSRDQYSRSKSKIEKNKINKSMCNSPTKEKHRSYSYSGLTKKYKSSGFSSLKQESKQMEKENQCVKLSEDHRGRIIIDRVQKREEAQDELRRKNKQREMMEKYQEEKAKQMFEKERRLSKDQKQQRLKNHVSRGKDHKFYFHEGEVVLFREQSSLKKEFPNKTAYHIGVDELEINQELVEKVSKSSRCFRRSQNKAINQQPVVNEHHRIKSARGEVFASAVLKTINLSRISLNETLRNLQVEQFMKRNDLFNNNHSRQTSSIPYMLPKSGTVYTQLSTNQVLGESKVQEDKQSCSLKSDTTRHPRSARRKSHFEPYWPHDSHANKTEQAFEEQIGREEGGSRVQSRGIKTAEANTKRIKNNQRRPRTSMSRGRITTANEELAVVLLH